MLTPLHANTDNILWALPFSQTEWAITPPAVQTHLLSLQQRVNQLQKQVDTLCKGGWRKPHKPPVSLHRRIRLSQKPKGKRRTFSGTRGVARAIRGNPTI
jgi:hypothetical protein